MEASGAEQLEAGSPRRAEPASPRRHSPRRHSPWGFAKALGVRDHEARFVPYDPWLEAPPWELAGLAALSALAYGAACLTPLAHGGLLAPRAGRAGPSSASGCSRRQRAARSRGWGCRRSRASSWAARSRGTRARSAARP